MEAGNGMPFQLRQLLCMSTSFKMLGKSCKCSSNEIGLSAPSKHIPAAPKCLFAMRLSGDCVNHSAFKGTCQEKFRSSTRQWHWNAAFSKTVTYINPEKKAPLQFMVFVVWGAHFPIRTLNFLVSRCMRFSAKAAEASYKQKYVSCWDAWGWAPGRGTNFRGILQHLSPARYPQLVMPPSAAQVGEEVLSWATQGLQYGSVAFKEQRPARSSTQPDCQADRSQLPQSLVKQRIGPEGL